VLGAELLLGCELGEKLGWLCTRTTNGDELGLSPGPVLEKYWGSAWHWTPYLERRWDQKLGQH
jgi:hypothetical protein